VFYDAILFKIHLAFSRRIESEVRRGVFCSHESTFVTDDLAHCLSYVSLVVQYAFDVNLDIGILQRPPKHGFSGVPVCFLFLIVGKKGVFG